MNTEEETNKIKIKHRKKSRSYRFQFIRERKETLPALLPFFVCLPVQVRETRVFVYETTSLP